MHPHCEIGAVAGASSSLRRNTQPSIATDHAAGSKVERIARISRFKPPDRWVDDGCPVGCFRFLFLQGQV